MTLVNCRSRDEIYHALIALLPRGRAWQTHDGAVSRDISMMRKLLYAIAGPLADLENATCAAVDEYFCAIATVDLDLWLEEYGLPDDCDPSGDDLCLKVADTSGTTSVAYYLDAAQRRGWSVDIRWLTGDDAEFPGVRSTLRVVVDSAASSAVIPELDFETWELGDVPLGAVDTSGLSCIFDRIIPAQSAISFQVI